MPIEMPRRWRDSHISMHGMVPIGTEHERGPFVPSDLLVNSSEAPTKQTHSMEDFQ